MKKILSCFLIFQLIAFLTGCCCPCGKKPPEQNEQNQPQEQTEQK